MGIQIARELVKDVPADSIKNAIAIKLAGNDTPMLGEFSTVAGGILFRPLIPLSRGLEYEIWSGGKLIGKVSVPTDVVVPVPAIVDVYPTADTVPENLLKMHILFSVSMQEGNALNNILLIRNGKDTMSDVFLDLQPELWNNARTSLTVWLDPGRIKRDLQPNKELGNPLRKGESYELIIGKEWQSTDGVTPVDVYRKKFVVGDRDDHSPDPTQWNVISPKAGKKGDQVVSFNESLDFALLDNTIHILNEKLDTIKGKYTIGYKEKELRFEPGDSWKPGQYTIEIESRLEDLSGNNLERLFDSDLATNKQTGKKKSFKKVFVIN